MIPSKPQHGEPIAVKQGESLVAGRKMQKFLDDVGSMPWGESPAMTVSGVANAAFVPVDCTAGDVTVTPQSFPMVIMKVDASGNDVIIGGLTVNGNPAFSWNTQYQAYTIWASGYAS